MLRAVDTFTFQGLATMIHVVATTARRSERQTGRDLRIAFSLKNGLKLSIGLNPTCHCRCVTLPIALNGLNAFTCSPLTVLLAPVIRKAAEPLRTRFACIDQHHCDEQILSHATPVVEVVLLPYKYIIANLRAEVNRKK
jgi:hypothetical protein